MWEERYPGITAIEDSHLPLIVENPTWHGTRHPVSIDRVVSDFLCDGATETFCALPRPAQKIVALVQVAGGRWSGARSQRQWIFLGSSHRAVNPEYNGQRYFAPEGLDGRYYTSAELASPLELDGTIYTDEEIQAARTAALKKLGPAG